MKTVALLILFVVIDEGSALNLKKLVPFNNPKLFENWNSLKKPDLHIAGGEIATRGQFPWTTLINVDGYSVCGGALISDRWILTAAECTYGFGLFQIYMGVQNWENDEVDRVITITTNRIAHEDFMYSSFINDISLLKLNQRVAFNKYIQPVALPTYSMASQDFAGVSATALGWGAISDNDTSVSTDLRYVTLNVITNELCKETWKSLVLDTNICTDATDKKSTCVSDFGGPLVTADNVLIGIQSFVASNGCENGLPSVFTRVTQYLEWIEASSGVKIDQ